MYVGVEHGVQVRKWKNCYGQTVIEIYFLTKPF